MSRSSRRKKIFDGSIVQHEEVESEYLQQSERSQKEGEVRMEES